MADVWRAYHNVAAQFFPGRLMIVDKFHVIKMAHDALDEVRKDSGKRRTREERIKLKDERFLLYKRKEDLTDVESDRLKVWFKIFPLLKQAYDTKERFAAFYDAPNRREGAKALDRCLQTIPVELDNSFFAFTRAVSNFKKPILNYFDDPATNAYTEAVNGLIRQDDRVGRGYSFEVMRARILFYETARKKQTSTRSRKPGGSPIPEGAMGFVDDIFDDSLDDEIEETVEYGPDIEMIVAMLKEDASQWPKIEDEEE